LWNELRTVGRITGNVLVASPDIGCDVQNRAGENLYQITHCIDMLKDIDSILNTTLDGFDYRLEINGNVFGKVIPEAASNVYAENRKILTSNGPVEKRSWRSLTETEIT
jgi:hypothetical protein